MTGKLPDRCLDQIFRAARTHNAWRDQDIPDSLLHELVDLVMCGRRPHCKENLAFGCAVGCKSCVRPVVAATCRWP